LFKIKTLFGGIIAISNAKQLHLHTQELRFRYVIIVIQNAQTTVYLLKNTAVEFRHSNISD
jgi:uncharacterized membrane protein YsdA (DUF1294 family)